ncbi:MAG TPA: class I SAM-dependent methyltransferase [Candidatus Acidoferrum sp.]|nr:class I SAM-dependent methyltransferase [Candidatus Acidoferrum sp.]
MRCYFGAPVHRFGYIKALRLPYSQLVFPSWNPSQPEISDLIVQYDAKSLARLSVSKAEILRVFEGFSNKKAVRVIEKIPTHDGSFDANAVDRLMLTVHWEMQRLAEEFYHGNRVLRILRATIDSLRVDGFSGPIRIVDVGCGIGYTIRWLAAHTNLPAEKIELTGVDLNATLVNEADRLARAESLPCSFFHGDAFSSNLAGQIYISTGVIHHFRGDDLTAFLSRHDSEGTQAFIHFDFQPWALAPFGSWFFHVIRMRTALARHDGVLSAARAHTAQTLVSAARAGVLNLVTGIYGAKIWNTPAPRVFHALVGFRPNLVKYVKAGLGGLLGELQ